MEDENRGTAGWSHKVLLLKILSYDIFGNKISEFENVEENC